ncbi:MAG: hypothetical protein ED557_02715 [Balneola sp.]|nr:MAG: hypothetical protein ED557_02715 [Balneola sp.]
MKITKAFFPLLLIVSFSILIYCFPEPFGGLFRLGLAGLALGVIGGFWMTGAFLWKKKLFSKIVASLLFLFSGLILVLTILITIDYRSLIPITPIAPLSASEWNEDLNYLKETIGTHPSYLPEINTELEKAFSVFEANLTNTSRDEKLLQLTSMVGLLEDGHSFIFPFQAFNQSAYLPLYGYYFGDGYFVLDAFSKYDDLIGKRIIEIEGIGIEKLFEEISESTGPENIWNAKYRFNFFINNVNLLSSLGILDQEKKEVKVTYLENEHPVSILIKPEPFFTWGFWTLKPTDIRTPAFTQMRRSNFKLHANEFIEVELNLIEDIDSDNTIKSLSHTIDTLLSSSNPKGLIIDLRNTLGGNNTLYEPLIDVITRHPEINQETRLFVLTSRTTFSAAINFLDDLIYNTNCTVVGEPPGAGANHSGDAEFHILPNSGIYYMMSTKKWTGNNPSDSLKTIYPEVMINYLSTHYKNGIDPWMNAINTL